MNFANFDSERAQRILSKTIKPKKIQNILFSFIFGLFASSALFCVMHFVRDLIVSEKDVEQKLGMNVIASVPEEKSMDK